ncbi:MAG TPA: hypothetical protein VGB30_02860 [bacterium]|jgi:hypothetical protein
MNYLKKIKDGQPCVVCKDGRYKIRRLDSPSQPSPVVEALNATVYICDKCGNVQFFSELQDPAILKKKKK